MRITVFPALLALATLSAAAQSDDINWLGSYKEALSVAKKTGKPIFLEYRCEP
jgi:hypothetical protein